MKNFLLSVIICFSTFTPLASYATHAAGLELRYEHLTGNNYRFHFILYRDCIGIAVAQNYTISGTSDCGGNISITVNIDSIVDVSQMCASYMSQCQNAVSPYMGIEANYYHGDVTLPSQCDSWTFGNSPAICNRNAAITNLISPASDCLYIETKLNNLDAPDNSSPVFTALPLFHLCNQVQDLHLYAEDTDGDSLSFEMYVPHSDVFTDVQYILGLSAYQPITYMNPGDSTQFDASSGDIRFISNAPQITVIGVRVNEFRNGILIGSAERDIEVIFDNCISNAPTASGINGTPFFTTHICADSLFSFQINTFDLDADSVRISWQNNIPGSSINLSGVNNQKAIFTWQPSSSQISSQPYIFLLYVTDSICPYVYFNSYQYHIYVDSCFATGIDESEHGLIFNASWSAFDQSILYSYEYTETIEGTLSLLNLQGQILWRKENISTEKVTGKIPASLLSPGLYLLEMKTLDGESRTLKVMKN